MIVIRHQSSPKVLWNFITNILQFLQTLLSGHALLSRQLGRSRRCPLNRGFSLCTVSYTSSMLTSVFFWPVKSGWKRTMYCNYCSTTCTYLPVSRLIGKRCCGIFSVECTILLNSQHYFLQHHHFFPCKMASEKWAQKFHTDDVSLTWSG